MARKSTLSQPARKKSSKRKRSVSPVQADEFDFLPPKRVLPFPTPYKQGDKGLEERLETAASNGQEARDILQGLDARIEQALEAKRGQGHTPEFVNGFKVLASRLRDLAFMTAEAVGDLSDFVKGGDRFDEHGIFRKAGEPTKVTRQDTNHVDDDTGDEAPGAISPIAETASQISKQRKVLKPSVRKNFAPASTKPLDFPVSKASRKVSNQSSFNKDTPAPEAQASGNKLARERSSNKSYSHGQTSTSQKHTVNKSAAQVSAPHKEAQGYTAGELSGEDEEEAVDGPQTVDGITYQIINDHEDSYDQQALDPQNKPSVQANGKGDESTDDDEL